MRLILLSLLLPGCFGLFKQDEEDTSPGLLDDKDVDGDGFKVDVDDCDDTNAAINPDASEVCDTLGTDEDCNGLVNDADPDLVSQFVYYRDADADGFGNYEDTVAGCNLTTGYAAISGDCDDADPDVNPAAIESCDDEGTDEDCNGLANDDDPNVDPTDQVQASPDADGDGFGTPDGIELFCSVPAGWSETSTDCEDTYAGINPDAIEICDNADDDCDGLADEDDAIDTVTWYADDDGDGYGDAGDTRLECDQPEGFVADATDCDDSRVYVGPGSTETCNGSDDDCDGTVDEGTEARDATTWYADVDGDNYGDAAVTMRECDQPAGYILENTDCDDANSGINPGATEICDSSDTDQDCDGDADDDDSSVSSAGKTTFYADYDGDGYGDADETVSACDLPTYYVTNDDDCDDSRSSISPAGTEICDSSDTDEDCDGASDDDDGSVSAAGYTTFYRDADGDGYGVTTVTTNACDAPSGYSRYSTDCDDTSSSRSPGATEVCDGSNTDEDCDGLADDNDTSTSSSSKTSYYLDADLDGYGAGSAVLRCDISAGLTTTSTDCDDADSTLNPGETEICLDGLDNNCDGASSCTLTTADVGRELIGDGYTDYAGLDVAGDGDFNNDGYMDILVGAPRNTRGGGEYGSTHVVLGGVTGTLDLSRAIGYAPGDSSGDAAGYGISFVGDPDGDGYDDFVVGLPGDTVGGSAAGKVLLFEGTNTLSGWNNRLTAYATWTGAASDGIGYAAAGVGDVSGDGNPDILIGAEGRSSFAGGAFLIVNPTSGTNYMSTVAGATFTGESASDYAGSAVDGAGDFDGDGYDDVLIGAYKDDDAGTDAGAAYVVEGPVASTRALSTADIKLKGETSSDYAGSFVAGGGDSNGDGYDDVIVAAPSYNSGTIYLFTGRTSTGTFSLSTATGKITSAGGDGDVDFGGDVDGDGTPDLLVGYDGYSSSTGRAYVYLGAITGTLTTADADMIITGEATGDHFGFAVAFTGDHDGDGLDDFVIGSPYNDDGTSDSGAAWVYISSLW